MSLDMAHTLASLSDMRKAVAQRRAYNLHLLRKKNDYDVEQYARSTALNRQSKQIVAERHQHEADYWRLQHQIPLLRQERQKQEAEYR